MSVEAGSPEAAFIDLCGLEVAEYLNDGFTRLAEALKGAMDAFIEALRPLVEIITAFVNSEDVQRWLLARRLGSAWLALHMPLDTVRWLNRHWPG